MKKLIAVFLALMLCLGLLAVGTMAADYQYITVTGTMNGWDPSSEADRMHPQESPVPETDLYEITYENMAAGSYEFKFTANGNWTDLDLGGAFMGSGVWSNLSWGGSNIQFTLEEAADVTILLDLSQNRFMLTIGDRVDETPPEILLHISVPEFWGATYVYVWGPEHLGAWPGTATATGELSVIAGFEGMVINNGNGTQSSDITDLDTFTNSEAWITVHMDGTYSISYEAPSDPVVPDAKPIRIHVIAPQWSYVYAYTYNPQLDGNWPGTLVENGVFETLNIFEGLVLSNGEGQQTVDIKDIDLTQAEVWITLGEAGEDGKFAYTLSYTAPEVDPDPVGPNIPTGDPILSVAALMLLSVAGLATVWKKKEN